MQIDLHLYVSAYLTGGPALQDGLSPRVRAYSRSKILSNLMPRSPLLVPDPYSLWILSSRVLHFMIDLVSLMPYGTDMQRRILLFPETVMSSSLMVTDAAV
jgi:hypothetical protein